MRITVFLLGILLLLSGVSVADPFQQHTVVTGFWAPAGISVHDMNADGHPDILGAAWNDDEISFWLNSGETVPVWTEVVVEESLDGAAFCSAADVNSDGITDIAACGFYADAVVIYLGQASGEFTGYTLADDLDEAHEVHLSDVNGDGLQDCIAAAGGSCSIALWINSGSAPDTWNRYDVCLDMTGGRSVCIGDYDNDGDIDLAGCGLTCDDIRWWENSGEAVPEWTEHTIEDFFNGAHMIRAADMNNDGFTDLVCAAFGNGKIGVWYNSGTTPVEWDKQLIAGSFGLALGVEPVDLNGDGMLDFAGTSMNPDQLAYWLNNGDMPSTWEKTIVDNALQDGWPIGSGDINGDGREDLTAGANGAGYIRWYENQLGTGISAGDDTPSLYLFTENPCLGSVLVSLIMNSTENVSLRVLDISGRTVFDLFSGTLASGEFDFFWPGKDEEGTICASGVYLIRAETTSGEMSLRKVTLLN